MANLDDLVKRVADEAKAELAKAGISFSACYPVMCGNSFSSVFLQGVSVDLRNSLLSKRLSEKSKSWEKVYTAIALERVIGSFRSFRSIKRLMGEEEDELSEHFWFERELWSVDVY